MRPFSPPLARFTNISTSSSPKLRSTAGYFTSSNRSTSSPAHQQTRMSSSTETGELKLESTVKTAAGVELSSEQKTIVSSVLDLFAGRPSLAKLQLWKDDAVFTDPITVAKGRKEFEPQWVCIPCRTNNFNLPLTLLHSTASKPPSPRSSASPTASPPPATPSRWT